MGCLLSTLVVGVAWLTGYEDSLAVGDRLIRVAPGTAILLSALAAGVWLRARAGERAEPWVVTALGLATVTISVVILISRARGTSLALERWLASVDGRAVGEQFGRVSPFTATLIGLLGASLALRRFLPSRRKLEAALAFTVVAISVVVLHGYLLGGAFFPDGSIIPVAAISAFLLAVLGIAQILLAGTRAWPLRVLVAAEPTGAAPPSRAAFRSFALLLSGVVLASGYFWYQAERGRMQARTLAAHAIAADLKAAELAQWIAGHLATANSLRALALAWGDLNALDALDALGALDAAARAASTRPRVSRWLGELRTSADYEVVALVAPDGRVLAASPDSARAVPETWIARVRGLTAADRVVVDERDLGTARRLTFFVPLRDPQRQQVRLWLALAVDVRRSLLPLVSNLPTLGESSSALLWRRDGDSAETISDLSVDGAPPGAVRVGLNASSPLPIVHGFGGGDRLLEGLNTRGVPVMAFVRIVTGTEWRLVVKIDRDEITAPVRRIALRATFTSLLLLLVIAAAIFALWYRRDLAAATRELHLVRQRDENLARLTQLDRRLRMRSATALALVRARGEQELFQSACDAAVNSGGFRMAWVGLIEHDNALTVRPAAVSGDEHGYLALNRISWSADDPTGLGPIGRCIRMGSFQTAQDLSFESNDSPRRDAARERGYSSSCAIPLKVRGEVVGAFVLYSAEPFAFHQEEVSLLGEVGDDLSYGISALRDQLAIAAQQAQLALFREVMERTEDAIYLTDARSALFIDFNAAALSSLGYTAEELLALGPVDVVHGLLDRESWRVQVGEILRGGVSSRRTMHRRKDGTLFPVDVSLTAIETADRRLVLSIARDITERVRAEDEHDRLQTQFLRSQRMESVGRLAGGVAHDFNNLLTVINGTADLAMADLARDAPLRADLVDIRAAGERAATLTRQLLAFSRQQVLRPEHLDLNEVVPGFLGMLKRVIGEDVVVDVRLGSASAQVVADHGQLEQVLMNLCVNARDAMPRGGRLMLEVEDSHVNEAQASQIPTMSAGRYVRLSVADTGDGMSAEVQARLFEPFFTTKEPGRGTGLGLSTVYGIVKQSGGHIGLVSSPGHGAKFNIYLPIARPEAEIAPPAPRPQQSSGSETILVVEDEEAIRFVVRRVLERSGYTVLEAPSGADALKVIRAHRGPLDLVMTDLVMPGMSGIELARTLRREHPSLLILLASGYSRETVSSEFDTAREWHLISKPYAVKDLLLEIRRVLDGAEPSSLGEHLPT